MYTSDIIIIHDTYTILYDEHNNNVIAYHYIGLVELGHLRRDVACRHHGPLYNNDNNNNDNNADEVLIRLITTITILLLLLLIIIIIILITIIIHMIIMIL